jgi:Uma2 family endonuclease
MYTPVRITVEQFDEMTSHGELVPKETSRVELIRGEIVHLGPTDPMSPINQLHKNAVDELLRWSKDRLRGRSTAIGVQSTLTIPAFDSRFRPDLLWLVLKDYSTTNKRTEDVRLLIEVSDVTLAKNHGVKSELYAEAGILDFWIVNITERCIEVRRDPVGTAYRSSMIYRSGQTVHPLAFPDVSLAVARLFPE